MEVKDILIIDSNRTLEPVYRRKLRKYRNRLLFSNSVEEACEEGSYNCNIKVVFLGDLLVGASGPEAYNLLRSKGFSGHIIIITSNRKLKKEVYNGITGMLYKTASQEEYNEILGDIFKDEEEFLATQPYCQFFPLIEER